MLDHQGKSGNRHLVSKLSRTFWQIPFNIEGNIIPFQTESLIKIFQIPPPRSCHNPFFSFWTSVCRLESFRRKDPTSNIGSLLLNSATQQPTLMVCTLEKKNHLRSQGWWSSLDWVWASFSRFLWARPDPAAVSLNRAFRTNHFLRRHPVEKLRN